MKDRPRDSREASSPADPGDQELFLQALEELEAVPDKDGMAAEDEAPRRVERRPPDKRLTRSPAAVLDLHGKRAEEAREALTRFVQNTRYAGERTALVITGKGHRSRGGVAVLQEELLRWIRQEGPAYLEAYSQAPRSLGGRGAYLLYLRR